MFGELGDLYGSFKHAHTTPFTNIIWSINTIMLGSPPSHEKHRALQQCLPIIAYAALNKVSAGLLTPIGSLIPESQSPLGSLTHKTHACSLDVHTYLITQDDMKLVRARVRRFPKCNYTRSTLILIAFATSIAATERRSKLGGTKFTITVSHIVLSSGGNKVLK